MFSDCGADSELGSSPTLYRFQGQAIGDNDRINELSAAHASPGIDTVLFWKVFYQIRHHEPLTASTLHASPHWRMVRNEKHFS
jgi:hypothetical protein